MQSLDYLIKNCSATDRQKTCPQRWSALKPAFADKVRHCDQCSKKVYLCNTDEELKFYSSVKFCIAIPDIRGAALLATDSYSAAVVNMDTAALHKQTDQPAISHSVTLSPNVWRKQPSSSTWAKIQHAYLSDASQGHMQGSVINEMPAFMRRKNP